MNSYLCQILCRGAVFFGLSVIVLGGTALSARTWTNSDGRSVEADFVALKGDTVSVKTANGRTFDIPLANLSEADQAFAKEQAANPPAPASIFKEMLEGKLVALEGKRVTKFEIAEEPQYYAFYFSASWCGPCKAFTPKLVSFYKENPGTKKTFEIIFMSRDHSEGDMEEYMKEDGMPWPAVRFRDADRIDEIKEYRGRGIPCLVLVDRQGEVVAHSYVDGEFRGPTSVMNKMAELAQSSASR